jgi:hypothetical protein
MRLELQSLDRWVIDARQQPWFVLQFLQLQPAVGERGK